MPKRKRKEQDNGEDVSKKLRKIERLLKKCKKRRIRIVSSSSEDSSQSLQNQSGGDIENYLSDASEIDSILRETMSPVVPPTVPQTPVPRPSVTQDAPLPSTSKETPLPSLQQEAPQPPPATSQEAEIVQSTEELEFDDDILELLGEDPTAEVKYGKDIRPELAARFIHIVTNGLNKDIRKELSEKYILPGNCTAIGAPTLNTEIKGALNETQLKRDKLIEYRQKRMAAAISCLGEAISCALEAKQKDNAQIKRLMDTARLLCDTQYNDSVSRRNLAVSCLKKEMKEPLLSTKIVSSLFGENLTEALKTAKAVTKSATDLKQLPKPQAKNWRTSAANRKPPPPATAGQSAGRRNAPAAPMTPAQPAPPPPPEPRNTRSASSRRQPPPPQKYTRRRY